MFNTITAESGLCPQQSFSLRCALQGVNVRNMNSDNAKVSAEMKAYQLIPIIANFINEDGSDNLKETIEANYKCVKQG